MNKSHIVIIAILTLGLSGCSWIGIGKNETYCAEHSCDYSDAGVCGNSYDVYKNWREVQKKSYENYSCAAEGNNNE